jgi:hypothetical protein
MKKKNKKLYEFIEIFMSRVESNFYEYNSFNFVFKIEFIKSIRFESN